MKVFDSFKRSAIDAANKAFGDERNIRTTHTLEILKNQVDLENLSLNTYNKYWQTNDKLDKYDIKKMAQVVDKCAEGNGDFYAYNINDDVINTMMKNITNEVFSQLKFLRPTNIVNGVQRYEEISETTSGETTTKLILSKEIFEKAFQYQYKYDECGFRVFIKSGFYHIDILKPYEYDIEESGLIEIITGFDENNKPIIEKRMGNENGSFVNGIATESIYFKVLRFDSKFYSKLESILDYQMCNSNSTKEAELNKTKQAVDTKVLADRSVINSEVMQLLDVPAKLSDKENAANAYFNVIPSKHSLGDINATTENKIRAVVGKLGLNRMTLGIGNSSIDYASTIQYENNLTAKTVNDIREKLAVQYSNLILDMFDVEIIFSFGKYALTSEEAILSNNEKVISSFSGDEYTTVAKYYDLQEDDEFVIKKVLTMKISANKTLTFSEERQAESMGLLPNMYAGGA